MVVGGYLSLSCCSLAAAMVGAAMAMVAVVVVAATITVAATTAVAATMAAAATMAVAATITAAATTTAATKGPPCQKVKTPGHRAGCFFCAVLVYFLQRAPISLR